MADSGGTEENTKSNYGKIIYKNFATIQDTEIMEFILLLTVLSIIILGAFLTILSLLKPLTSTLDNYIAIFLGLFFIISGCIGIIKKIDDGEYKYPKYSLFENGILGSGFKSEKNRFIYFKDIISVSFIKDGQKKDKLGLKIFYNDFQNQFIENNSGNENRSKIGVLQSFDIKEKNFKDITKFRQKILPILNKYQIELIDK